MGILLDMDNERPVKVSQPRPKPRRKFGIVFNLFLLICVVIVAYLFIQAEIKRRAVESDLRQLTGQLDELKKSSQNSGAQVAEETLTKVRRHIDIPTDPAPTVATIIDVENLRKENSFYEQAQNGDYLVITEKRAILYNAQRDIIIDVVPISISDEALVETPAPTPVPPATETTPPAAVTP